MVKRYVLVSSRSHKVKAGVNTLVDLLATIRLLLLAHVALVLVINEINDGHPRVFVVDIIAKSGGVDNSELDLEVLLFQFSLDNVNLCGFVELLSVSVSVVLGCCQLGCEEGVNERRLDV